MPFAPSILGEYVNEYLLNYDMNDTASYFMTATYNVTEKFFKNAPAAVHVDNTCRPQIVVKKINPRYYNIINNYYRISHIPIIINTSFNMHEEPIVCSAKDAIKTFIEADLDVLVMNNYWIEGD